MNPIPTNLATMLDSRTKDMLCGVEFYSADYDAFGAGGFQPDQAEALFATSSFGFVYGSKSAAYFREVFSMPSLSRNLGKQSNTVTIRFSNVSRNLADFVLNNTIEGMRVVLRVLSRSNLNNPGVALGDCSFVAFVGRCQRQDGFDRGVGSITAKQDLGQVEAVIPPTIFQKSCPLDFGGTECLGTEVLTDKNAAFQTAFATLGRKGCDKTFGACTTFANTEFFQGLRVAQIPGSFLYKAHQGFFAKLFHIATFGLLFKRRQVTVDTSLEDLTPYGKTIPEVLGRWQMSGIPLQYQDSGINIFWKMAWCRGLISAVLNLRCNTPGFSQPGSVTNHLGDFGGSGTQTADTVFPDHAFHSRLAYTTGAVTGSQIDVQDPAPDISAMIAGISPVKMDTGAGMNRCGSGRLGVGGIGYAGIVGVQWQDNPVELVRYIFLDPGLLALTARDLEIASAAVSSWYCAGAIKDTTNAERLLLPNTETGKAGTTYHRYNTTGLITKDSWPVATGQFPFPEANHEAVYEFYNPASPPLPADLAVKTFYRKRYTANIALTEQKKVVDFLFDTLLPTFRGFLTWNNLGQIKIKLERPADSILLRSSAVATDTTIQVQDIVPWRLDIHDSPNLLEGKILIGVDLATSEVRRVTATAYSTAANSITLAASASGGPTATASGATLTGGTTSAPATGRITIGGTLNAGATVTATIDGHAVTYTLEGGEDNATVAAALGFAINADPALRQYVEADNGGWNAFVDISSKLGTLTLSSALEENHTAGEETIRVVMSFANKAVTHADTTKANILDGTFKYLGSNGQTRYNQFKGTFHNPLSDFAEEPVVVNDYAHQEFSKKISTLDIDLSAVDNYSQASRLLNGAASKFGDGVDFYGWSSNGLALQLEEGDVVCVTDDSATLPDGTKKFRNVPVRIETVNWNDKYEVSIVGRKYLSISYDDQVDPTDVVLRSDLPGAFAAPPTISFNTTDFPPSGLIQSMDGAGGITSIRGGAVFGSSPYAQYAYVRLIKRAGATTNEQVAIIHPDSNNKAIFEFVASADGLYTVELEVCNQWACNTTKPTASIIIGFGSLFGIATEGGSLFLAEGGNILELEH